ARAVVGKALRLFEFFGSDVCSPAGEVEILAGPLEIPPPPEEKSLAANLPVGSERERCVICKGQEYINKRGLTTMKKMLVRLKNAAIVTFGMVSLIYIAGL